MILELLKEKQLIPELFPEKTIILVIVLRKSYSIPGKLQNYFLWNYPEKLKIINEIFLLEKLQKIVFRKVLVLIPFRVLEKF